MLMKDDAGNIVGCDKCGSRSIKKDGWQYWKAGKKRQRWQCKACGKKMLNPKIIEKSPFEAQDLDVDFIPIDDIIKHRKNQFKQKLKARKRKI